MINTRVPRTGELPDPAYSFPLTYPPDLRCFLWVAERKWSDLTRTVNLALRMVKW